MRQMKMMLGTHAPPNFLIKFHPLYLVSSFSSSSPPPTFSLPPSLATARPFTRFKTPRPATVTSCTMAVDNLSSPLLSPPEHVVGPWYSVPDLRLRDHRFSVPLNYSSADRNASPKLTVFAREVVGVGKEDQAMPYLLFLQGGPGFECPRPSEASGWLQKACEEFRVLLMDQRGTGLSTALTPSSMSQFSSAGELAEYLTNFRADNIVKDAEFIRIRLVPDAGPWTVLGQSYGGFCAVTYLSFAPQGLKQVLLTGGTPPLGDHCTADVVYRVCSEQVIRQNEKYYERFPQDVEVVREVVEYLANAEGGGVRILLQRLLYPYIFHVHSPLMMCLFHQGES
ncbi:Proline iminopeptidase [Linum grandiflorum]